MRVILIDNKRLPSGDKPTMESYFELIKIFVQEKDIDKIVGIDEFNDYFSRRNLGKESNLTIFIHESFEIDWVKAREIKEREPLAVACEKIREVNSFARIIVCGFATDIPLPYLVKEVKADTFVGLIGLDQLNEILYRGDITPEEIKQRGKTIEFIDSFGEPRRVTGERILVKLNKEREGD